MSVIQDKYQLSVSTPVTVNGDEKNISLELTESAAATTGTVTGVVYDSVLLGATVTGATVKLFTPAGVPVMHTTSGANGQYTISDVPPGTYLIGAVKDGYLMSVGDTIVVTVLLPVIKAMVLLPDANKDQGAIYGIVTSSTTSQSLNDVDVALYAKEDQSQVAVTATIMDGEYVLEDLNPGTYTILFSKSGYDASTPATVTVTAGASTSLPAALTPSSEVEGGTISGIIADTSDLHLPIIGAFVGLYTAVASAPEELIAVTYTNTEGKYMFGGIEAGDYIVKAKATM